MKRRPLADRALEGRVEDVPHEDGDVVVDARGHRAGVQHLRAEVGELHGLVVLQGRDREGLRHAPRVRGVGSVAPVMGRGTNASQRTSSVGLPRQDHGTRNSLTGVVVVGFPTKMLESICGQLDVTSTQLPVGITLRRPQLLRSSIHNM